MEVLLIGVVGKAHGLKGEVVVHPHNPESPLWAAGTAVLAWPAPPRDDVVVPDQPTVTAPGNAKRLTIARARRVPGANVTIVAAFADVVTRDQAEALRGLALAIAPEALPAAEADEVYHHEVVGWSVMHVDGRVLGTVVGIMTLPAQDVIEMTTTDGRGALIPFVGAIVKQIDRPARALVLDPPAGLIPGEGDEEDDA